MFFSVLFSIPMLINFKFQLLTSSSGTKTAQDGFDLILVFVLFVDDDTSSLVLVEKTS